MADPERPGAGAVYDLHHAAEFATQCVVEAGRDFFQSARPHLLRGTLAIIAMLGLAPGCGSSPKPRYYTLSAEAETARDRRSGPMRPGVGIAPVSIPDAVDRPQLVVGLGGNELDIIENHRWAGPLKRDIPWVIAENLVRLLDNPRVSAYPQSAALDADYRVMLDFQRLDARPARRPCWTCSGRFAA